MDDNEVGINPSRGYRSCTQYLATIHGDPMTITFDSVGIPTVEGMEILCLRSTQEILDRGSEWACEAATLNARGFRIVEFGNCFVIFQPRSNK